MQVREAEYAVYIELDIERTIQNEVLVRQCKPA